MAKGSVFLLKGKIEVAEVVALLNAALSEEWLAYYQYWIGAQVVEGAMRYNVQKEFEVHAREEAAHAELLAKRIVELEGIPVLDPRQWFELARCKYEVPLEFDVVSLLKQNIEAERCAVSRYQEIARITDGKDFTTCDMAKRIMADEEEHEQDLQDYLRDIEWMKETFFKEEYHADHLPI